MKRKYHVVNSSSKGAAKTIRNFCQANGQMLLPLVDLISEARLAVDEIIDQAGRSLIETILTVSAEQVAGEKTPGKATGEVRWHGRQKGRVRLANRQLRVERPRLRRKSGSEVGVPAYQVAFVRVLGRWKSVILYGEIKIDTAKLKMGDP